VGEEGVSQSSASLRLIELRLEAWQQAAILSDTGGNVNDVNDATGARVFQNKLINCLVAPTNFTTHPGPDVRPHMVYLLSEHGIWLANKNENKCSFYRCA